MVPKAPLPPPTVIAVEPVPPPEGEATTDAEPKAFGGGLDLSLLPLYPDHTAKHIWDEEVGLVRFILFNLRLF